MERSSTSVLILGGDLQLRFFSNFYLVFKGNIGNMTNDFKELLTTEDLVGGYGLTMGYDSWIGPIEISMLKAARRKGLTGFFNIGYWF
jgi:outer membrane translocation and assembly module TamA